LGNFSKVTIRFYCPIHSDPSSIDQVNILKNLVGKHPQVDVVVNTSYLSDTEILEELQKCNFLIYAYKDTGETASAAVRHGISSGVPVIVTPSPIFDSTRKLVFTSTDYSATKIAEKVIDTHRKLLHFGIAREVSESFQKIVTENSRSSISERVQGMSQGLLNML
jgi:glycosyltransferase involved in cell wall biosynthesis